MGDEAAALRSDMDKRFTSVDGAFASIKRDFRIMRWMLLAQMVLQAATFATLFTAVGARWAQ